MIELAEQEIDGVFLVSSASHRDERGGFARLFCAAAFDAAGVSDFVPLQSSVSTNPQPYTLRGMHYQAPPYAEAKLVQVVQGAVFDAVIDLRSESRTYGQWMAKRLDAENGHGLFIPKGCAHGFLTLTPDAVVVYHMDAAYKPEAARGVRWNDPAFAISWPATPKVISERDAGYPDIVLPDNVLAETV